MPEQGHRCDCKTPACYRWALNQVIGGKCVSCAAGFHAPCDELALEQGVIEGECRRCRWWSTEHER